MRDCMFWLFSWVFFTVCISLEELVREFLNKQVDIYICIRRFIVLIEVIDIYLVLKYIE